MLPSDVESRRDPSRMCHVHREILKPPSIPSLTLQEEQFDIVLGLKQILKSVSALQSLAKQDPKNWATVKLVVGRVSEETEILPRRGTQKKFTDYMFTQCSCQALSDLQKLDGKMREQLEWTDVKLLRSILVFLDMCSWAAPGVGSSSETREKMADIREAVEHVISVFREPLEAKGACLASLDDELEEAVQICRRYLNSQLEDYKKCGSSSIPPTTHGNGRQCFFSVNCCSVFHLLTAR